MKVIEFDINKVPKIHSKIALCLGFFDGIHLGHQELIKEAKKLSKKVGVLTFDIPPAKFLSGEKCIITTNNDKIDIFKKLKINYLFIMKVDQNVLNLECDDFISKVLKILNPKICVCGEDYSFGKDKKGNINLLKQHFSVQEVPLLNSSSGKYSSGVIRDLIKNGKIRFANEMLGRNFTISGIVKKGLQNGRLLTFPTANIYPTDNYIIPSNGVYVGYSYYKDFKYKSLICIGTHPTISELDKPIIEVHLFNFNKNIYNKRITVEFVTKLRGIIKFKTADQLRLQIEIDKISASEILDFGIKKTNSN